MKPVIVLVGRPNVGKSTLFNRLTRARDALVAAIPGLTRDRQYGDGRLGHRSYLVVDTGGVVEDLGPAGRDRSGTIEELMQQQTRQAMDEGDAVIFLVDGRAGSTPADRELANFLRRLKKPVVVVVNKAEGLDHQVVSAEFHQLGLGDPVPVSAKRGDGVTALIERVLEGFPPTPQEHTNMDVPRVAVAGRPNVGKSTLINCLLGEERVMVYDAPGTTRDSISVPFKRNGKPYIFIDTAGVRRKGRVHETIEKFSVIKTLQAIEEANVVILVLDADQGLAEQDASLAGYVLEKGRALIIAVNKCDKLDQQGRQWIEREVARRFAFVSFIRPHYISALHGTGVAGLFRSIDRTFASACKTLGTSQLNRVLQQAIQSTQPPMVHGRRIKLKFAHQGGKNPPLIVVHGNQVQDLPESYRRYLANTFRKVFRLEGTPIRIECRQGSNPYADKKVKKSVRYREEARRREQRRRRR